MSGKRRQPDQYLSVVFAALPADGGTMTYPEIQKIMRPTVGIDMVRTAVSVLVRTGLVEQHGPRINGCKAFRRVARAVNPPSPAVEVARLDGLIRQTLTLVAQMVRNAPTASPVGSTGHAKGWVGVVPVPVDKQRTAKAAIQLLKAFQEGAAIGR